MQTVHEHPIQQVAGFIQDRRAHYAPNIPPPLLHESIAHCGLGMDYPAGERPLVVLRHAHASGRVQFKATLIVSDRRLFGRDHVGAARDELIDIPFAHVTGSRLDTKLVMDELVIGVGPHAVKVNTFGKELAPFFEGLARVPHAYRSFAPAPPALPGPIDTPPVSGDPRIAVLRRVAREATRVGLLAPSADIAARIALLDQELSTGRGMSHGFWLSTLPRAGLAMALAALLGQPIGRFTEARTESLDFAMGEDHRVAKAVVSSTVGLAPVAAFGLGWIAVPRGQALRSVRATLCDFPCGSGFTLAGTATGQSFATLSRTNPKFVDGIHQALFRVEARHILAQCALGHPLPPDQLLWAPRAVVEEQVRRLGATVDLSPFFAQS